MKIRKPRKIEVPKKVVKCFRCKHPMKETIRTRVNYPHGNQHKRFDS